MPARLPLKPLWAVLLLGLLIRLPFLTHPGCQCDVRPFAVWGWATGAGGLQAAYDKGADYPPVVLLVIGGLSHLGDTLGFPPPTLKEDTAPGVTALVKLPILLSDL